MDFTIRESSIQLDPSSDIMERIEVEFNLNGRYQRILSYTDTQQVLTSFDKIVVMEIEALIEAKAELRKQLKRAIKTKEIKTNYCHNKTTK